MFLKDSISIKNHRLYFQNVVRIPQKDYKANLDKKGGNFMVLEHFMIIGVWILPIIIQIKLMLYSLKDALLNNVCT